MRLGFHSLLEISISKQVIPYNRSSLVYVRKTTIVSLADWLSVSRCASLYLSGFVYHGTQNHELLKKEYSPYSDN